jgi:hypothetical protein
MSFSAIVISSLTPSISTDSSLVVQWETLLRLIAAPASSGDMPELYIIEHNLAFIWFFPLPSIRIQNTKSCKEPHSPMHVQITLHG